MGRWRTCRLVPEALPNLSFVLQINMPALGLAGFVL